MMQDIFSGHPLLRCGLKKSIKIIILKGCGDMDDNQYKVLNDILDVLKSLDRRITELEHKANIQNKYYNDGELKEIQKIWEELYNIKNA
jgi:hypothetical protein